MHSHCHVKSSPRAMLTFASSAGAQPAIMRTWPAQIHGWLVRRSCRCVCVPFASSLGRSLTSPFLAQAQQEQLKANVKARTQSLADWNSGALAGTGLAPLPPLLLAHTKSSSFLVLPNCLICCCLLVVFADHSMLSTASYVTLCARGNNAACDKLMSDPGAIHALQHIDDRNPQVSLDFCWRLSNTGAEQRESTTMNSL